MAKERWIVVSNRLPFTYSPEKHRLIPSSGGLVAAIKGIRTDVNITWVGSVPGDMPETVLEDIRQMQDENVEYYPVPIAKELYEKYYNGACNDLFWPLFHYESNNSRYVSAEWEAYQQVNRVFSDAVLTIARAGDLVWVHDFHLFLVSGYVKAERPDIKVGFFLHIPFPSSEIYKQIPVREEVLNSLLESDLIGFHDSEYLRHFCSSVYGVLGIHSGLLNITKGDHVARLGAYPVSIDTGKFISNAACDKTRRAMDDFALPEKQGALVLGVDRLDYTKGIDLKLLAFRQLLINYGDREPKPQLLQIAVPSRLDVPEYIQLKESIDKLVGEINGEFSTPSYTPIRYVFNAVQFHELLALYRAADVIFVTSKRDGMNLVCLEYVAAQDLDNPGVVLLSEFAGAISALSHAIPINPWDLEKTADKLQLALDMPLSEKQSRHRPMFEFLKNYTASHWAESFMKNLSKGENEITDSEKYPKIIRSGDVDRFVEDLHGYQRVVLLLDYDGTLVPIAKRPELARLDDETRQILHALVAKRHLDVVVISGRPRSFLYDEFKDIPIDLASDHGGRFFSAKSGKWHTLVKQSTSCWYEEAYKALLDYSIRTPGSFVEKKDFGMVWHYRESPPQFAEFQSRKLFRELEVGLSHYPVEVISGKKVVEVKAVEANKGVFVDWLVDKYYQTESVFFIAIGDDRTDEDMFKAVNAHNGMAVKVGRRKTLAKFSIPSQEAFVEFLHGFAESF